MNAGRLRRLGAILGTSGCSIALVYAVVHKHSSEHAAQGQNESAQLVLNVDKEDCRHGGDETTDVASQHDVTMVMKRSMRQRMKDAIDRRRTQQRFPWNGWWNLGRYRSGGAITSKDVMAQSCLTSRDVASLYSDVVGDIRNLAMNILGSKALLERFDDVELARYAVHYGILRIHSYDGHTKDKARQMVVQDAAEGVADSQNWFQSHEFASIQDIHTNEFSRLIWWEYNKNIDERPVLHVDIGKAVEICQNKRMQLEFANIVLTMMELAALNSPLIGIPTPTGGIDRIDVRIYVQGTNTMNATKTFWILRAVVKSVSHHYPGRLNTLVLYDLPVVLNWIVLGVKKLVHPETASKFSVHKS